MKMFAVAVILMLGLSICSCDNYRSDEAIILPHDALTTDDSIRETLERLFPGQQIPIFESVGGLMLAVVEDFESERFLLVRAQGWQGDLTIERNGVAVSPPFEEMTVRQYGATVTEVDLIEDRLRVVSDHLGSWLPLKRTDTFRLDANLEYPELAEVSLRYDPQSKWSGSIEPSKKNKKANKAEMATPRKPSD